MPIRLGWNLVRVQSISTDGPSADWQIIRGQICKQHQAKKKSSHRGKLNWAKAQRGLIMPKNGFSVLKPGRFWPNSGLSSRNCLDHHPNAGCVTRDHHKHRVNLSCLCHICCIWQSHVEHLSIGLLTTQNHTLTYWKYFKYQVELAVKPIRHPSDIRWLSADSLDCKDPIRIRGWESIRHGLSDPPGPLIFMHATWLPAHSEWQLHLCVG